MPACEGRKGSFGPDINMDNRSRGFRLAAAAVMLVFLLAVSAFAMAEADPIRVSSLSEPQSVISEQDVSITIKIYNSSQTDMTEEISLYDPTGGVPVSTYNGLQGEQSVTYTGTWHVTQDQIKEGKIKYYIQYSFDSGNGLDKVVRAVPVTIQTEAAAPQLTATYTLSPTSARKGQKVAVEYTLSNTGNIELRNIAISNEGVSSKKLTAPSLSVGEKVTLQDSFTMGDSELVSKPTVTYQASGESKTYTISGVLMDKATGEPLLVDGAEVTAEVEFTPESADGTVELTYTLDASTLAGTTIVVFETLYSDGVEIAAHADINDEAQTITINPRGGLLIQKTSEDGVLEGFTFLVEGEGYSETFTTDGAGTIYIEDLAPGEYTITEQESEVTARYEIPAGQTVTVTADEATTVEFYNRLLRGKITGHKTGAEQAPLAGVTFGLFPAEATEFTAENAIEVTSSNEAGEFSFEAPYGNYQVAELETVPGYVTKKESIAVELDKTDVDLEDIANSQTVVHFSKVDKDTGEELPGAVLELYAPDGSLLDTWETSDIPHVIPGLPVGEGYVLREVTAPEGFEVAEDVTFHVEDTTEIQTITMEDEKTTDQPEEPDTPDEPEEPDEPTPDVPQTGGSRAVIWVSGLLILALLGLCITVPLLRHINKQ